MFTLSELEVKKIKNLADGQSKGKLSEAEKRTKIINYILELAKDRYSQLKGALESVQELSGVENPITQIEKGILLKTIDNLWIEHLDNISYLRTGIGLRAYAQADPLVVYKKNLMIYSFLY